MKAKEILLDRQHETAPSTAGIEVAQHFLDFLTNDKSQLLLNYPVVARRFRMGFGISDLSSNRYRPARHPRKTMTQPKDDRN